MFTQEELDYILAQGLEKIAAEAGDDEDVDLEDLIDEVEDDEDDEDDVEKAASAYGLTGDELEYVLEQGLEKIAEDETKASLMQRIRGLGGRAASRFKGLHPAAKAGILAGAGLGLGAGGYGLYRRRKNREKVASGFTNEELAYIFEQGLEKVAEDNAKASLLQRAKAVLGRGAGRFKALHPAAKAAILAGAGTGVGAGAYGLYRRRKNREKVASFDGLDEEALSYIVEQGLEKIASEVGAEEPSAYDIVMSMLSEDN